MKSKRSHKKKKTTNRVRNFERPQQAEPVYIPVEGSGKSNSKEYRKGFGSQPAKEGK